jgi:hypothetical protein
MEGIREDSDRVRIVPSKDLNDHECEGDNGDFLEFINHNSIDSLHRLNTTDEYGVITINISNLN